MLLRMKNFNNLEVKWRIRLLRGFTENQYRVWDYLKRGGGGLRQFTNLGRGLTRKTGGGGIFEGERVDTPMHTMNTIKNILGYLLEKKVHQYQWNSIIMRLKGHKSLSQSPSPSPVLVLNSHSRCFKNTRFAELLGASPTTP